MAACWMEFRAGREDRPPNDRKEVTMTNQHQPFDDDPELYEADPEMQGGTTHGQDEADDRATLLDDGKNPGNAGLTDPRPEPAAEYRPPKDDGR
jgi:hypothetical protein